MALIHKARQTKQIRLYKKYRSNLLEQVKQIRLIIRSYKAQIRRMKRTILYLNTTIHELEQNLQDRSTI